MARKSKGFNELLLQKKDEELAGVTSLNRLKQKVKQADGKMASQKMVVNPKGVAKMSEILEEFIEPYKDTTQDFSDLETLLNIAVLAWNITLVPRENRQDAMGSILLEMTAGANQAVKSELQSMLNELIARKDRHFSNCQRFITSFDLQDLGDDYYLSVASTLQEQ